MINKSKLFDSAVVGTSQESLDFITNILESSTQYSIIGKDLEGKIVLWNEGARLIYGYGPEEVVGKANSEILHTPEDIASGKPGQILREALRDGKWEGTLPRVRKDGSRFTARVVITPRRDSNGKPIGFLLISKDITDEIRLTEELKATQFYTRSLIESNIDALMTTDPSGAITDVNKQMEELTGYSRRELIGSPFKKYFTDPRRAEEGIKLVLREGRVTNYELVALAKDGKTTDVSYNASTFSDAQGKLQGVFAAARDIGDQKQASQYARSLIEASLDPLVTISPEGKITDVNEATIKITGVNRETLIGTDFANYFTEPEKAQEGYMQVLERGYVTDYPLTIRHRDGRLTDVLYNASVYRDVAGKVLGVFAAARDITAQKQASQYARSLIEASLDPLVTISADGKITDVNEATIKVTGNSRERLIGTDFANYFTEPEKAREGYKEVLAKGYVMDYPLTIRHKNGKLTDVLYNASVYSDVAGNVLGVFAAARDITAQKKAEAQVAEQRTKELERLAELERFQRLTVGRELKMIELKKEIEELKKRSGAN